MGTAEAVRSGWAQGQARSRSDGRRFLDALLWLARSGGRWRDLPARFGPYQTAKRRYYRRVEQDVFDRMFEAVSADPDFEWLAINATVIRAHAQAAGARTKRGDLKPRLRAGLGGSVAERVGFEPTVPLPAQRFSRPSQSTTLAPLRRGVVGAWGARSSRKRGG